MKGFELESERQRKLHDTSKFILKLLALGVVFRFVLAFLPDTYIFQSYLADITGTSLKMIGINLEKQGALLVGERGSYLITRDCLGWKSMAAFMGLVIASAKELRGLWKPLVIGISALAVVNYIRIITTVLLSYHGVISFEIIHTVFWKWGLTLAVFIFWMLYLRKNESGGKGPAKL